MQLDDFDFLLPSDLIAQTPASPRDHSRLLRIDRTTGTRTHHRFSALGEHLKPGDCLVLNNTKVLPARLFGVDPDGRRFEVLLLESQDAGTLEWSCLVKPGKKVFDGLTLSFPGQVEGLLTRAYPRDFKIRFSGLEKDFFAWLDEAGEPPLPPYLKRAAHRLDRQEYQTVYAKERGSVAAPTAGLHFTPELLASLRARGILTAEITLHVGYGTFAPIRDLNEPRLHAETFHVPSDSLQLISAAKKEGRRVIAVGTTSLRTLESLEALGPSGRTELFIRPGYRFAVADGLITNFHLPKSSLYVLVCAFLGLEQTRQAYREAIRERYRFYSYGDAMLLL